MNTSFKLEIEVLTPVHIGSGLSLSWLDYFCYSKVLENTKIEYRIFVFWHSDLDQILDDGDCDFAICTKYFEASIWDTRMKEREIYTSSSCNFQENHEYFKWVFWLLDKKDAWSKS